MDNILISAKGVNGQLELLENKIRIKRKGLMGLATQGLKGDKEIFIKQISSVQFKKAGMMTNGYIQFAFIGGQEAKGGIFQATKDENSIMFKAKHQRDFEAIKAAIEEKLFSDQPSQAPAISNLDELEKLASLKDKGIISQEEFEAKKKQLLGI